MTDRPWKLFPFEGKIGRRFSPAYRTRSFVSEEAALQVAVKEADEMDWPMIVWAKDIGYTDVYPACAPVRRTVG